MTEYARYRKTATVDAKPYEAGDEDGWRDTMTHCLAPMIILNRYAEQDEFVARAIERDNGMNYVMQAAYIQTLEGPVNIRKGSWICRDEKGNRWPVDGERFAATYERVDA